MDKQAVIRRVRIAVSVFFGLLAIAIAVLWVRSNWYFEEVWIPVRRHGIGILSLDNTMSFTLEERPNPAEYFVGYSRSDVNANSNLRVPLVYGFTVVREPQCSFVYFPHWFAILLAVAAIALPWLKFSLRTMLIATTLGAVVLGLGVWLAS